MARLSAMRCPRRTRQGQKDAVDDSRFDALTRLIGTTRSRRDALRSALGATALGISGVSLLPAADTEAKNKGRRRRKNKKKQQCYDAGDSCTNSAQCCPDTTRRICEVQSGAGNSDKTCCGGNGAFCGGRDENEDALPPFCCQNFACNKVLLVCQSVPD